jgi:hypothetical protein
LVLSETRPSVKKCTVDKNSQQISVLFLSLYHVLPATIETLSQVK